MPFLLRTALLNGAAAYCPQPAPCRTINLYLNVTGSRAWAENLNGTTSDYALWFSDDHYLDGDRPAAITASTDPTTGVRTILNTQTWLPYGANGTYFVEIESEVFTQSGFAPNFRYDHADLWPSNLTKETWSGLPNMPLFTLDRTYTLTGGQGQFAGTVFKENGTTRATTGWPRDAQGRIATFTNGTAAMATYAYESGTGGMFDKITTAMPGTGAGSIVADFAYETRRDVLDLRSNQFAGGGAVVSAYDYTVNSLGQRTGVSATGTAFSAASAYTWGYDALGQVTSADHATAALDRSYTYDAIGNRKRATTGTATPVAYAASPTNAYSKTWTDTDDDGIPDAGETAETLKYDLDGNLIEDATRKYTWDGANRLRKAWNKGSPDVLVATYEYDYRSRRLRKTTTASAPQGVLTLTYFYDGWNPVAEYESPDGTTHSLRRTRYWGLDISGTRQGAGGVSGLVSTREWTGTGTSVTSATSGYYYYTYDGNGNVSEVLSYTGTITAHFEYDAFGNLTASTGPATGTTAYRFSTKPQDRELGDASGNNGWYYYGYRYYDSVKGRWPSRDPKGESGGINLNGMVQNNLIGGLDILGLNPAEYSDKIFTDDPGVGGSNITWRAVVACVHGVLDVVGMVPVFGEAADGINAIIYLCEGDPVNAAISGSGMLPVGGQAATGGRVVVNIGGKMVEASAEAMAKAAKAAKDKIAGKSCCPCPPPNGGIAPPHGGPAHNKAIDDKAAELREQGAENLRKNQKQADAEGNKAGDNKPDLQADIDGQHHNYEWDTKPASSAKHRETVTKNDPNAVNEFNLLPKPPPPPPPPPP